MTACTLGSIGIVTTARYAASGFASESPQRSLEPGYSYLRVTVNGAQVAWLVLGYVEASGGGGIEVWYGAEGEVIKLRDGRIVSTVGLSTDWRRVVFSGLADWTSIGTTPYTFIRDRDVMPGYRLNIREHLAILRIPPPASSLLVGIDALELSWFEESLLEGVSAHEPLPPARYALRINEKSGRQVEPIYGEQCLATKFCLSWQRLTALSPGTT